VSACKDGARYRDIAWIGEGQNLGIAMDRGATLCHKKIRDGICVGGIGVVTPTVYANK
jgi:hypothetical protein